MHEPLGGAAGQHTSGAADVGGAHHDQAGILFSGELAQPAGGRGTGDRPDLDGLVAKAAAQALEQSVAGRAARMVVGGEDVDEHQRRAGDAGQAARQGDRVARAVRLVHAHDDLAHDRPFPLKGWES